MAILEPKQAGTNLGQVTVQHAGVEVVFKGDQIILPHGMEIQSAIVTLQAFAAAQEQVVVISEEFNVFPWDGANALSTVLKERFGWTELKGHMSWFGRKPPELKTIEIAPNVTKAVPWGVFSIPGVDAEIGTGAVQKEERWIFTLNAKAKRKHELVVRAICDDMRRFLKSGGSIYQGQSIKLRFTDGEDDIMPEPQLLDTNLIDVSNMLFNDDIATAIEVNLFTPIRQVRSLADNSIPFKRGVLFAGTYGTGKTMAASAASILAVEQGITFVYTRSAELSEAIDFARGYAQPGAVVFCEDIDRETEGERDEEMDELLNLIDGIDAKSGNILVVLTTNQVNNINVAMLRPGRLDAVIEFVAPNAKTAERIVRRYCGAMLDAKEDLTAASELLAGQIPAVLAEVVKRAKLAQLSLQGGGRVERLTGEALRLSAQTMMGQVKLLADRLAAQAPKSVTIDELIRQSVRRAAE